MGRSDRDSTLDRENLRPNCSRSFRPGSGAEPRVPSGDPTDGLNLGAAFFNAPGCSLAVRPRAREICLDALGVRPDDVVWDVGAGTGSVALVGALRHPEARFYALEQSSPHFRVLQRNVRRLGTTNVIPCFGRAPEDLGGLPRPDRVYLGGTGGRPRSIIPALRDRILSGGCFVGSFLRDENFVVARTCFDSSSFRVHSFTVRFDRRDSSRDSTGEKVYFLVAS